MHAAMFFRKWSPSYFYFMHSSLVLLPFAPTFKVSKVFLPDILQTNLGQGLMELVEESPLHHMSHQHSPSDAQRITVEYDVDVDEIHMCNNRGHETHDVEEVVSDPFLQ